MNAGRPPSAGRLGCLLALLLGLAAGGLEAQADRSWTVESFEADIRVLPGGDVVVEETIRPRFRGSFNGIYRLIPVEYRTPAGGFEYDLRLRVEEVTDAAGRELRHETSRERHYRKIKVWVPDAADATRTVRIRYRAQRALRFFDGDEVTDAYDELYWNVTGDEWPVPIERASATVHLPVEATGIRAVAYTGAYGSRDHEAEVTVEPPLVRVRTTDALAFREGLTVGVAWDPGAVERPSAVRRAGWFVAANWPLLLPILAFVLMLRHWHARGRDPEIRAIAPRYEPPEGLSPAEVGVVVDNRADMRDVTATLVDLAVRGYLRIEETEEDKLLGLLKEKGYVLERLRGREAWDDLEPHERKLLQAVFDARGDRVALSELENEFYKELPAIKDDLMSALVQHGVYERRPDRVVAVYLGGAVVVGGVMLALGLAAAETIGLAPAAVVVAAVLTALVIAGFGLVMPARTREGARTVEWVRGFEEFLGRVESDRFRRMITGPEMFEAYLPFAMALGVEKQWAAAFDDLYREPPSWYRGSDLRGFRTAVFVNELGRMSDQASNVMTSAPRSSGGSSFGGGGGGGGFSGGGFGGGGGGAF